MSGNQYIKRHHHLTLSVGNGQEDYDFHTQVLGLKSVKKTALYDGDEPILHLYYGNDTGDPGRLITCFPMKHSGRKARKGTGQVGSISLAVPETALGYWEKRLREHRFNVKVSERFGERFVQFQHPCGIEYELVGAKGDKRAPYSTGKEVPIEHGIKGTHGICVSIRDAQNSDEFMQVGWNGKNRQTDGNYIRYEVGDGGSGAYVEFRVEPDVAAGSWTYGEGVPHHVAFEVDNHDVQSKVKFHLEGIGFTDVSEMKDRGYFDSVYVRTPGGALFEATVTKPKGFLVDEPYEKLGTSMQIPPFFASRREELLEKIEPLRY